MSLVAFILGAGSNVGRGVAQHLKAQGYTVVLGSRSAGNDKESVKIDVTQPDSISAAFSEVESRVGAPSVVVFNAAGFTAPPGDAASVPIDAFARDAAFGTTGLYAAVQASVAAFRRAPASAPKTFIVTGNILAFVPVTKPLFLTLGLGKRGAAYQIELFASAFKDEKFRFYYASQISRSGGPVSMKELSGKAHGIAYWNLIQRKEQGEWDLRFYEDGSEGPHEPVHS